MDQDTETDLSHYNVYRGTSSGFSVTPGKTSPVGTPVGNSYASTGLNPSTKYYYRIAAVDNAGNIGPLSSEVSKTTAASTASTDKTPPTVTSTSPASGATSVIVASPVKATFSEPVQSWSSSTIFTVKNGAGTSFSGTIALSTDHTTVTFSHSSPFAPSTSYTVTITTGVKDLAGNAMTSIKTWSFTTAPTTSGADTTPPSVSITSPANNLPATSNTIKVAGTSADSGSGIKNVMVRIKTSITTTGYTLATPKATNDWSTWSVSLSLSSAGPTGPYTLEARAEDNAGNMQWSNDVIVNYSPSSSPPPSSSSDFSDSFSTPYSFTQDGQVSPDGKWKMKYLSGGKTEVANGVLTTYPAIATTSTKTYSTLVMSTQKFQNFQLDFDMRTNKQMRTGSTLLNHGRQDGYSLGIQMKHHAQTIIITSY